jgi:hypothetical protein
MTGLLAVSLLFAPAHGAVWRLVRRRRGHGARVVAA